MKYEIIIQFKIIIVSQWMYQGNISYIVAQDASIYILNFDHFLYFYNFNSVHCIRMKPIQITTLILNIKINFKLFSHINSRITNMKK